MVAASDHLARYKIGVSGLFKPMLLFLANPKPYNQSISIALALVVAKKASTMAAKDHNALTRTGSEPPPLQDDNGGPQGDDSHIPPPPPMRHNVHPPLQAPTSSLVLNQGQYNMNPPTPLCLCVDNACTSIYQHPVYC